MTFNLASVWSPADRCFFSEYSCIVDAPYAYFTLLPSLPHLASSDLHHYCLQHDVLALVLHLLAKLICVCRPWINILARNLPSDTLDIGCVLRYVLCYPTALYLPCLTNLRLSLTASSTRWWVEETPHICFVACNMCFHCKVFCISTALACVMALLDVLVLNISETSLLNRQNTTYA